jgi:serine/threonine protein kinase
MERLTKSHYIVSIYGMCGSSQITEYSEGGNIHDRIKEARLTKTDPIPSIDKLKIAYQVASAVADMHTFEQDGVTSLVHLDICCHQFVLIDGVYKLGDFHLSSFLTKRRDNGEICLDGPPTMHAKVRKEYFLNCLQVRSLFFYTSKSFFKIKYKFLFCVYCYHSSYGHQKSFGQRSNMIAYHFLMLTCI